MEMEEKKKTREVEKEEERRVDRRDDRLGRWAEKVEKQRKRNNVVTSWLVGTWTVEQLEKRCEEKLEIRVELGEVWTIGKERKKIVARCKNEGEQEKVMVNKSKFRKKNIHR